VNRDDVIRMARDAGFRIDGNEVTESDGYIIQTEMLTDFAQLVAAAERESCAKVCDEVRDVIGRSGDVVDKPDCWCAAAIRARSE